MVTGLTSLDTDIGKSMGFGWRTTIASIAGGTASALGGGKFASGAWTSAFHHILNAEMGSKEEEIAYYEQATGEKLSWLAKFFFKNPGIGDAAESGANFAGGFSDGVLFGQGKQLALVDEVLFGNGSGPVWVNEQSGWYKGGVGTGIGASIVASGGGGSASAITRFGANSAIFGKASRLFGTGSFRNGNGIFKNNNLIRIGWGKNQVGQWGFRLAAGPNKVQLEGFWRKLYQYVRHVHY